jgi:hypothetical protein
MVLYMLLALVLTANSPCCTPPLASLSSNNTLLTSLALHVLQQFFDKMGPIVLSNCTIGGVPYSKYKDLKKSGSPSRSSCPYSRAVLTMHAQQATYRRNRSRRIFTSAS